MSVHSLSSCCASITLHKDAFEGLDNKTTIEKQVERTVFMQLLARLPVVNILAILAFHFCSLTWLSQHCHTLSINSLTGRHKGYLRSQKDTMTELEVNVLCSPIVYWSETS